jgi:hypothetical protein
MGLFKSGKNEKVDKVDQYEEYHDESPSKHHPKKFSDVLIRPMPQLSMMGNNANSFPSNLGYSQPFSANFSSYKSPFSSNTPYDLSRYPASSIPMNPYFGAQPGRTNFPAVWSNGMFPYADRSPFQQQQQPSNNYQQNPWSYLPPSTNGFMPPYKF